jgi:hypothetical protein
MQLHKLGNGSATKGTNTKRSLWRPVRRPGSFSERRISRHCGIPWQTEGRSFGDHLISESVSVMPLSIIEASFCCALFYVFMARVRCNLEQRVFIYDCYVKRDSYKSCRRKFHCKFPDTCPSGDTISKLVKKVWTSGILIDRKPLNVIKRTCNQGANKSNHPN